MMSDHEEKERAGLPPGGLPLGGLAAGGFDSSLGGDEAAPAGGPLELPRGALVAFRKSGGLRFSSRGVVVTRGGWVEPMAGTAGRRRHITPEALAVLERLILRSGLTRVGQGPAPATRDGFAYEIAAHVAGRARSVELHDPVPEGQERLVQVLTRLLPR